MANNITQMGFNRKEAAQYLGISESTLVNKLMKTGRVPFQKIDSRVIISKVALDRFLEGTECDGNLAQVSGK